MSAAPVRQPPRRALVVLPNWVGDVVLATPALAALRGGWPQTQITFLMRRYVRDVVAGGGWHDDEMYYEGAGLHEPAGGATDGHSAAMAAATLAASVSVSDAEVRRYDSGRRQRLPAGSPGTSQIAIRAFSGRPSWWRLSQRLRARCFDAAILFPNAFRAALLTWLARIPRRVGYARDGRSWLLTDRLRPLKRAGVFVPSPITPAYGALAAYVGCPVVDWKLRLGVTPEQEQAAEAVRRHYGLDDGRPYAVLNPGAAFGASKCWPPEHFGRLADELDREFGLRIVVIGAGREAPVMRRIAEISRCEVIVCIDPGTTLGSLKGLIRDARLLVCNDTGPRHYGNAFDVPTVALFGPTHQAWTDTGYRGEIRVQLPVECGPCQLPVCPLDHRCMRDLTPERALDAVRAALGSDGRAGGRRAK